MRLPPFSFAVFDTETTGFVPRVHHVIEFASMRAEGGQIVDTYEQLFAVKEEIPAHVQVLTRIRQETIAGKPVFEEKRSEIEAKLSGVDILVGQNLGFDLGMIKGEGIDLTGRAWVDTSMLASLVFPEFRSFSLQYMSSTLKLNHEPAHRALGDVRATLELFAAIWERLQELTPEQLTLAKDVMSRSSDGYRIVFDALPASVRTTPPTWITPRTRRHVEPTTGGVTLPAPSKGTLELREEGLHAGCLQDIINAASQDSNTVRWIAVKNLESALKRLHIPQGVTVVHPPQLLLNPDAATHLAMQTEFSSDEALLRLKLEWFKPRIRNDVAVHGNEKDLWNGKLACTVKSAVYVDQFSTRSHAFLIDHRQLFSLLADPAHAAHGALTPDAHIIVDDASMLEDTATKAYGHYASVDDLRAAAGTDSDLIRFADLLALLAEKIRGGEDQYFVTPADLRREETVALREQAEGLLARSDLPAKTLEQLREVRALLEQNLPMDHIVWIERRMDGQLTMHAAPEHVDRLLRDYLYTKFPTTLLVPRGSSKLPETVPADMPVHLEKDDAFTPCALNVNFPTEMNINAFLQNPPAGKTIILAGSKRVIEQAFIQHTETLEAAGVTLLCQGMSGGQGRMESDFLAAASPAILMVTPFMYEGLDFPEGTADRLVLDTVPFDHPNQPVVGRRRNHYKNAFSEYNMPRVEHRLFRLMRTFCRHRRDGAEMLVFDKRLVEKDYGARLQRYMAQFSSTSPVIVEAPPSMLRPKAESAEQKPPKEKKTPKTPKTKSDGQMQLPF